MPGKQRAILTDLDGIYFRLVDHFGEYGVSARFEEEIKVVGGLGDVMTDLEARGYIFLGNTNQPDIARKKITPEFLEKKHAMLRTMYPQIKKIFICTHTETDLCPCRKPKPGLFLDAEKEFDVDFSVSWVISDAKTDIQAGAYVRAKTILVQTNWNAEKIVPVLGIATAVVNDTRGALKLILDLENKTSNKDDV